MDGSLPSLSNESLQSPELQLVSSCSLTFDDHHEADCTLCGRTFLPDYVIHDTSESICLCTECIHMLEAFDTNSSHDRQHRERQSRYSSSSECSGDVFSEQFSQLITSAGHIQGIMSLSASERELIGDSLSAVIPSSIHTTPNRSGRWRALSDDEGEHHGGNLDCYLIGETDSNLSLGGYGAFPSDNDAISFSIYGAGSDLSVDHRSHLDQEWFLPPDQWLNSDSNADIDPMNAGQSLDFADHRNDIGDWEAAYLDDESRPVAWTDGSNRSDGNSSNDRQTGATSSRYTYISSLLAALDEPDILRGDYSDHLDAMGFEELLEQLAETDNSRRAPPAAAVCLQNLPRVIISSEHVRHGCVLCAICKEPLIKDTEANKLPCSHLYHPTCILPWLSTRNSCPVCRYELPTDDRDDRELKHLHEGADLSGVQQQIVTEVNLAATLDAGEVAEAEETASWESQHVLDPGEDNPKKVGGRSSWLLAVAPIVSIFGVAFILWFGRHDSERTFFLFGQKNRLVRAPSSYAKRPNGARRRWWSLF